MSKLESIKKGCRFLDSLFEEIIKDFKFKTENELAAFIRKRARQEKLKLAFPVIVAAGSNSSEIHHKPNNRRLKGFVVLDFGVKVNGFCSDMTRTIFVGKPSKHHKEIYNLVKKIQKNSTKRTKARVNYRDIDLYARNSFGKYRKFFAHALGHGVGSKIHQFPTLAPRSKHIAKTGDIITIEPGLYFKNKFGVRIEDTVLVKRSSAESLNKCSKELKII